MLDRLQNKSTCKGCMHNVILINVYFVYPDLVVINASPLLVFVLQILFDKIMYKISIIVTASAELNASYNLSPSSLVR